MTRYGDPINPRGDLEAMARTMRYLKEGGLMFLAVPIGKDTVVWNAHRVYGKARLPLLLEHWDLLERCVLIYHNKHLKYPYDLTDPHRVVY